MSYKYETHVDCSMLDNKAILRLDSMFDLFEIMFTEYLNSFDKGNITLKEKYDAAWVVTKAKLKIIRRPIWSEKINLELNIVNKKSIKIDMETKITDKDGNLLIIGIDELCPISLSKRRIIRLSDIEFEDFEIKKPEIDLGYPSFSINDLKHKNSIFVKYSNIDFTNHCNNVSYVNFIVDELGYDFFNNYEITDISVHYLNESRLDDKLDVYRLDDEDHSIILLKNGDKNVFSVLLKYKKI